MKQSHMSSRDTKGSEIIRFGSHGQNFHKIIWIILLDAHFIRWVQ